MRKKMPVLLGFASLVLMMSGQVHAACEEGISIATLEQKLEEARQAYFAVEYDQAIEILEQVQDGLACTSELVPIRTLHRFNLTMGAVQTVVGRTHLAQDLMERSLTASPGLEWDDALGSQGEVLFQKIKTARKGQVPSRIEFSELNEGLDVALDGELVNRDTPPRSAGRGEHFVQVHVAQDAWENRWVQVSPWAASRLKVNSQAAFFETFDPDLEVVDCGPVRPRSGPYITGGFGVVAVAAGVVYAKNYKDLEGETCGEFDACMGGFNRGTVARDITIAAATGAVVSAVFTWLLPELETGSSDKLAGRAHKRAGRAVRRGGRPVFRLAATPTSLQAGVEARW